MIISICGKSGSGKSTLAKKIIEERKNAIHIDIDRIAHQVLTIPEVKQQLQEQFKDVLTNNEVDRKKTRSYSLFITRKHGYSCSNNMAIYGTRDR